jgi:hypothetical protein
MLEKKALGRTVGSNNEVTRERRKSSNVTLSFAVFV